ncbi:MAG: glycosyltransferase [Actinomycetota bacterium]|nr:glycosyltransferase [Actinomycetota bacterium]
MIDHNKPRIALIVPAYNEEDRVGEVIAVAKSVKLIDEIVVVNDGSSDNTALVAKSAGVRVVNLPTNHGKGYAMQRGIRAVNADILIFSDADILGLREEHFLLLIKPLLVDAELMMTVGKFSGGRLRTDLSQNLMPSISGQRALRRALIAGLPDLSQTRFGVEMALTRHAKSIGAKTFEVILNDLSHVMKEEKLGMVKGLSARLKMYQDMYRIMKPPKGF